MQTAYSPEIRGTTKRYSLWVALVVVLFIMVGFYIYKQYYNTSAGNFFDTHSTFVLDQSKPVQLIIPKLEINAPIGELGLNSDKTMEIPSEGSVVGWYKHKKTPGEKGPAILVGHLDWQSGPGVFYNLDELEPGDMVKVKREDGTTAVFSVAYKKNYHVDEFDTEQVYGNLDHAGLRLITCSGKFLKQNDRYSHNLVVFADLIAEE
jgi:LPXTG-site transpeptidase (sortase) family protein